MEIYTNKLKLESLYKFRLNNNNILSNNDGSSERTISASGWPTVVDAIQKAGGLTNKADLRNIK